MSAAELPEFEMVVILRIKQRGVDTSDAAGRAATSLISALRGKSLLPDPDMRSGYWDDSLGTRVQQDASGRVARVLMIAPAREP